MRNNSAEYMTAYVHETIVRYSYAIWSHYYAAAENVLP